MTPEVGRAALATALFLVLLGFGLLLVTPRDSPTFIVSVLSLVIGVIFFLVVLLAIRWLSR